MLKLGHVNGVGDQVVVDRGKLGNDSNPASLGRPAQINYSERLTEDCALRKVGRSLLSLITSRFL